MQLHYPPCDHCGNALQIYRTDAVGRLILNADGTPILRPGPTPRYCSDAHKKRAQRHMPNVRETRKRRAAPSAHTDLDFPKPKFRPSWVPKHPVDDTVRGKCGSCGAPLYRNGQKSCPGSEPCRRGVDLKAQKRREQKWAPRVAQSQDDTAYLQATTLANDAIDRCDRCDDDGLLPGGGECGHG